VNPLRVSLRVSKFSGLLLGLSLYSFHVRELLVCWLFFSVLFALLCVVMAGVALACYAGRHVFHWASSVPQVTPAVVLKPVGFHVKTISGGSL
jgi:hypothetical protein